MMQRTFALLCTIYALAGAAPIPSFSPRDLVIDFGGETITLLGAPSSTTLASSESSSASTTQDSSLSMTSASSISSSIVSSSSSTSSDMVSSTIVSLSSTTPVFTSTSASITSSTSTSSTVSSSTSIPSSSGDKVVVAHMMVGNTFPFTQDTWKSDIQLAQSSGIDGFALNIGTDPWQPGHVADAYAAAKDLNSNFKLFLSFDMTVMPCNSPDGAASLRKYITDYATHPNQLKVDGKVFASTFAGETCNFGQGSVIQGWTLQFTQHPDLSGQNAVHFVPSFFIDPATFDQFNGVMDGAFNWNSGWPIQLNTDSVQPIIDSAGLSGQLGSGVANVTQAVSSALAPLMGATLTDDEYRTGLAGMAGKKTYMAAASPWFFTHYGPDSFNKNFIWLADSHLYPTRWEKLVEQRDQVDIVELVTWNDYGESHYLKDPTPSDAQPNSQAWVDNMSHAGWLQMTAYYAQAFKTGSYPTIEKDEIYMWSRPHARDANAPDSVDKPSNFQLTEDAIWAVVFAVDKGTITISAAQDGANGQTFDVQKGVNKLSVPISAGGSMKATLKRGGKDVLVVNPEFTFQGSPEKYNFNANVVFAKAS